MEISGLNQVSSEETRQWAEAMWKIFDRGVKAAKAENERLGIVVNESVDYIGAAQNPTLKVAESDEE